MTTVSDPMSRLAQASDATQVIERLLGATASRGSGIEATVDDIGPHRVAPVLLEEILFRACLEDLGSVPGHEASVTILLTHRGTNVLATTISVGPSGVSSRPVDVVDASSAASVSPLVSQELWEVAFALYGPSALVTATTRRVWWPGPEVVFPTPERPSLPTVFYALAQRIVQVLDRREPNDLTELAVRYGTDKWGAMHQYPRQYERHFSPLRDRQLRILEIGIGGFNDPAEGGGSLRTWKRYFPRALVYGIDILDKSPVAAPRLTTIRADQSSEEDLLDVLKRLGPFDIVIDDGSHNPKHVLTSFHTIFPHLPADGLYVVEDLQACYWPEIFEGSDTDLNDPNYTVGFLKTLLDGLHHEEFLRPDARVPLATDAHITGVHVYRNLAVIEKGPNVEGSMVANLLRSERQGRQ
ncbi:class I SAM-dependent methyltransferase [Micromonospora chersina]|uniref:class I SAM-dependent methyltransferase n=1 Tax=Micromonospora chersina TaxID=47854 RepID=UPI0033D0615A